MLRSEQFWKDEGETSLMKMEKGFIKSEGVEKIIERTSKWHELAGLKKEDIVEVEFSKEEPERIFILDAERTFSNPENKKKLVKILTHLKSEFGDYQQGISFVASFFMLTMDENENIALMKRINSLIPGYWKHEAINFGTSAFTLFDILEQTNPKITDHLKKNAIDAGTFCQRWFLGLNVHILPFKYLFQYIENFLQNGVEYLYQFALSLFSNLESRILAAKSPNEIFELLYLSHPELLKKENESIFQKILDDAKDQDIKKFDLVEIGKKVYEEKLKKRIESAHKVHQEVQGIDDCQWCLDNLPEFYCVECAQVFCEDCLNDKPAESHNDDHKVITMDEFEDNRDKYISKSSKVDQLTKDLEELKV